MVKPRPRKKKVGQDPDPAQLPEEDWLDDIADLEDSLDSLDALAEPTPSKRPKVISGADIAGLLGSPTTPPVIKKTKDDDLAGIRFYTPGQQKKPKTQKDEGAEMDILEGFLDEFAAGKPGAREQMASTFEEELDGLISDMTEVEDEQATASKADAEAASTLTALDDMENLFVNEITKTFKVGATPSGGDILADLDDLQEAVEADDHEALDELIDDLDADAKALVDLEVVSAFGLEDDDDPPPAVVADDGALDLFDDLTGLDDIDAGLDDLAADIDVDLTADLDDLDVITEFEDEAGEVEELHHLVDAGDAAADEAMIELDELDHLDEVGRAEVVVAESPPAAATADASIPDTPVLLDLLCEVCGTGLIEDDGAPFCTVCDAIRTGEAGAEEVEDHFCPVCSSGLRWTGDGYFCDFCDATEESLTPIPEVTPTGELVQVAEDRHCPRCDSGLRMEGEVWFCDICAETESVILAGLEAQSAAETQVMAEAEVMAYHDQGFRFKPIPAAFFGFAALIYAWLYFDHLALFTNGFITTWLMIGLAVWMVFCYSWMASGPVVVSSGQDLLTARKMEGRPHRTEVAPPRVEEDQVTHQLHVGTGSKARARQAIRWLEGNLDTLQDAVGAVTAHTRLVGAIPDRSGGDLTVTLHLAIDRSLGADETTITEAVDLAGDAVATEFLAQGWEVTGYLQTEAVTEIQDVPAAVEPTPELTQVDPPVAVTPATKGATPARGGKGKKKRRKQRKAKRK